MRWVASSCMAASIEVRAWVMPSLRLVRNGSRVLSPNSQAFAKSPVPIATRACSCFAACTVDWNLNHQMARSRTTHRARKNAARMGHMTQPPFRKVSTTMLASTIWLVQFENDGPREFGHAAGRKFPAQHGADRLFVEERPWGRGFRKSGN